MHLPSEDRYTQSRQEMLDELTVLMGGRAAEEITFDEITSGAAADIEFATKIARRMVCIYGMSKKLGTVQYGGRDEHIYIGRDIMRSEGYSEETSREIDTEMKDIIDSCKNRASSILNEKKESLELLAKQLMERETLDVHEIKKLIGMKDDNPNPVAATAAT